MQIRKYIIALSICLSGISATAATAGEIVFRDEAADTTRINEILMLTQQQPAWSSPEERTAFIAKQFVGTPYVAHTLEGDEEVLRINMQELDCTTFVETVLALSMTAAENRWTWRDFAFNLERLRYRRGEINGYASRLHYICDWFIDNEYHGLIIDATRSMPAINYITRTINFMTANRDRYPALADSVQYERMLGVESGFRNHRFPYVKKAALNHRDTKNALHTGDVVALVSNLKNLDVTHMGVIVKIDGEPHLLHASLANGQVEITTVPLTDYLRRSTSLIGIRIARLRE